LEGVPLDGKAVPFCSEDQASLAPRPGRRLCFGRNMSPSVCIEDPGGGVLHPRANWGTPDAPSLEDTGDAFVEQLTFVAPSLFARHNHSLGNAQIENLLTFLVPSLFARRNCSLGNAQLENLLVYQAWSARQTSSWRDRHLLQLFVVHAYEVSKPAGVSLLSEEKVDLRVGNLVEPRRHALAQTHESLRLGRTVDLIVEAQYDRMSSLAFLSKGLHCC
jgi:hypothetical protein